MRYRTRSEPGPEARGNDMAEHSHKHGEMDISAQEKTFAGFMRWTVNIAIVCLLILVFLAIFAR